MSLNLGKTASAFALSCVLCLSSTTAVAASRTAPQAVNPLATISIFGSPAAATALCGSNAAIAVAGAAAAQAPAAGCVLPVVDPAPPPPVAEPVALPPPPPPAGGGIGLLPILLGVAGLIGLALLIASQDDDDDDDVPASAT